MTLDRLYRALLALYPRAFRDEFGEEMEAFFEERILEARRRGRLWLLVAASKSFADLLTSAALERRDARRAERSKKRGESGMFNGVTSEARNALRSIVKRPGLSATAIVTLALGLGATSVVFAVINAVLLRPLPYDTPERIVTIWNRYDGGRSFSSPPDYIDRKQRATTLERLAAVAPTTMNLSGGLDPRHVDVARVSSEFFDVFGARDERGNPIRFPNETSPEAKSLAVLSYGLWQSGFGGAPGVRGRGLELNGERYEIVGVLPEPFDFPRGTQLYVPLRLEPDDLGDDNRGSEFLLNLGRLKAGASVESARAEMETIAASVLDRVPERRDFLARNGWGAMVVPLHEQLTENVRPALKLLAAAVVLVLVVSGANVASILLTSLAGRARELAVRSSLGASRARLVRQLVVESSLLSFAGGGLGLALSAGVLRALPLVLPEDVPRIAEARLDFRVLVFTATIAVLTGVLCGIVPAWQASSGRLHGALRAGASGTGSRPLRRVLVVSEVALALTLLVGAGLLVRSFEALTGLEPGFVAQNRLTLRLRLPEAQYPEPEQRVVFQTVLLERLRSLPGVRSAAVSDRIPLDGSGWTGTFYPVGYEAAPGEATPGGELNVVSPGYFQTLGIPFVEGRDFSEADARDTTRVAIVDAWTAERFWPNGALGQRINMNRPDGPLSYREIVGVVGHVKTHALDEDGRFQLYFASTQVGGRRLGVSLQIEGPAEDAVARAREEVAKLAPGLPIYAVQSLEQMVSDSLVFRKFQLALLSAFAGFTLLLATVGLYGALSYSVSRRQVEIGVRVAMGAGGGSIVALVLKEATVLVALGLAAGSALAASMSRFIERLVFGIEPTDAATFLGACALLLAIAALASWLPARRASRIDPIVALRG